MDCNSPTMLSLCTGAGGLELGLKLAIPGCRTVCYVEGEAYAASILAARMEDKTLDAAPVWSDLRTFDSKPWRGCVDIIAAGYPCQPFSIAGRKQAENDPRHLWPYIRDIVADLRPRIAFFENVSHHLRLGFEQVHDDLRGLGYGVKAGLFTAEEVGATHKRERLFILAHSEGVVGEWLFPERYSEQYEMSSGSECPHVANAAGARARIDQSRLPKGIVGNGKAMVDATRQRDQRTSGHFSETNGRQNGSGLRILDGAGDNLADTAESGLERLSWHEEAGDGPDIACGNSFPAWPPGPRDAEAWGSIPAAFKPAVHRMADGMADRVDRIRLCGNGVVPLAAAYAFRTLMSFVEG